MKNPSAQSDKSGKGNRTGAVGDTPPAESTVSVSPGDSASNVGAISDLTLGQVMQMVGVARGGTASTRSTSQTATTAVQKNRISGISDDRKSVIGVTRTGTGIPEGLLLVDSGAVDTCFPEGTFDVPVDTSKRRDLYGIEGSLIRNNGRQHPVVRVGPEQVPVIMGGNETSVLEPVLAVAKILDNGRDVHFTRAGSYIEGDDGERISFFRIQDRFWLPYTTAETANSHNILAPIVGAPEAAPIGEEEIEEKGADEDWGFLEPFDPEAEADPEIMLFG